MKEEKINSVEPRKTRDVSAEVIRIHTRYEYRRAENSQKAQQQRTREQDAAERRETQLSRAAQDSRRLGRGDTYPHEIRIQTSREQKGRNGSNKLENKTRPREEKLDSAGPRRTRDVSAEKIRTHT